MGAQLQLLGFLRGQHASVVLRSGRLLSWVVLAIMSVSCNHYKL